MILIINNVEIVMPLWAAGLHYLCASLPDYSTHKPAVEVTAPLLLFSCLLRAIGCCLVFLGIVRELHASLFKSAFYLLCHLAILAVKVKAPIRSIFARMQQP